MLVVNGLKLYVKLASLVALALLAVSCAVGSSVRPSTKVSVIIDSKTFDSILKETEVAITVYGWDRSIADAPASILKTEKFKMNKIPIVLKFDINENIKKNIKPSLGTNGRYRYYLGLKFDSSRFFTDFKNTNKGKGPLSVNDFSSLSQTIYIKSK